MASTLSASAQRLEIVDRARRHKGWNKTEVAWQVRADVSKSTLDRFWMQKPIKHQNFVAICEAVGVDWEQVVDLPAIEPTNITRKSNLAKVNQPVILELEEFAQAIFEWFEVLDFKFEGLPRRDGKYVEWIIQVPVRRSRFDRVLIRATIHEIASGDLESLRRGVAQLRVDEGWLVTNLWVSQSVRQALTHADDRNLDCLTFDELIDRDADFTSYLDWLEVEIKKKEIDRYYVNLGCTKGEFDPDSHNLRSTDTYGLDKGGIDFYIDRWLGYQDTAHISILGEFGTGKTWFALHYAWKCLQAYKDAKVKGMTRPRLPLVIPLRDYAKALNIESLFSEFFFRKHEIDIRGYSVFDKLNQMGKLLLIFDGFDEMADRVDEQKMINNFWELARSISPNAKVILTCRKEHFPNARNGRDTLRGELMASTANLTGVPPQFETLELMKFDDAQIREVLSRRTNAATVELVMANSQLLDLLRRAVMAEFVLEALPEIEAGKPIDLSRVYLYAVRHKMERDITTGRTFTSLADKLYFLCELAWEMLSQDKMSINYREFPDRLRVLFGQEVAEQKHLDHWHYDMMGQTMLIRNDDGDYSPAHRSLLEFFVAYKFAAELGLLAADFLKVAKEQSGIDESLTPEFYTWSEYWRREVERQEDNTCVRKSIAPLAGFIPKSPADLQNTFGKSPLSKVILDLLLPALNLQVHYRQPNTLIELIQSASAAEVTYAGGNAATILVELEPNGLEYHNLSGTNLAYANLVNAGLRGTDLQGANLENCLTTRVFGIPTAIVMTKDDLQVITAHYDGTIRIWERSSGRELQRLTGHQNEVNTIVLSSDGRSLYSGGNDGTIKEWDLTSDNYQRTFEGHQGGVNAIALSIDGRLLYSGGDDGTINEWNLTSGNCRTFAAHQYGVNAIVLSSDGRSIYSGDYKTIKEWELADGSYQRTFEGYQYGLSAIALSSDGRLLYSGGDEGTINEWDLTSGSCRRTFEGHQSVLTAIALSIDGRSLYSSSYDWTIKEWDLTDGLCRRTFEGHRDRVTAIALSIDGRSLYSGSQYPMIKEWNLADSICQKTFRGYQNPIYAIAVDSDGQLLYSGSDDGRIREWNLADGICQRTFENDRISVGAIAISADGKLLYSGDSNGTIREWNLANGVCQRTFEDYQHQIRAIAVSDDGQLLYSGSDNMIREWNLANGTCQRTFESHQNFVSAIALSRDGQLLYSGSGDRTIKEWKLADGTCQYTFMGRQVLVNIITLSRDKQLFCSKDGETIEEWKLGESICHQTFESNQGWLSVLALSKNGQLLYSGGGDGKIKEWDIVTGEYLRSIDTRLCAGADITNAKGLTPAQIDSLLALGAIDRNR